MGVAEYELHKGQIESPRQGRRTQWGTRLQPVRAIELRTSQSTEKSTLQSNYGKLTTMFGLKSQVPSPKAAVCVRL